MAVPVVACRFVAARVAAKRGLLYGRLAFCRLLVCRRNFIFTSSGHDSPDSCPAGRRLVLGIETSCDDTGAAIVDDKGRVLGEDLHSQTRTHVLLGGIIPPIARDLHLQHIEGVVSRTISMAAIPFQAIDAIAVTVKPGLALSLKVGLEYAKGLVQLHRKPLIPIHHMEAHALTVRMMERVMFPFLVLLVSGGHCLLALAQGVDDFLLLGRGVDDSPGDAFDKVARRLKLKNMPMCEGLSGGTAVELLAKGGDPHCFTFPHVMTQYSNCNFSFSGLKNTANRLIQEEEARQGVIGDEIIKNAADLCASFQHGVLKHLAKRLQRAFLFCEMKKLLPEEKTLVMSGGVASNQFLRTHLKIVCDRYQCRLLCPPAHLCTDNGVMIAWNGIEKLLNGSEFPEDPATVDIQPKCPLGEDLTEVVQSSTIKLPRIKLFV